MRVMHAKIVREGDETPAAATPNGSAQRTSKKGEVQSAPVSRKRGAAVATHTVVVTTSMPTKEHEMHSHEDMTPTTTSVWWQMGDACLQSAHFLLSILRPVSPGAGAVCLSMFGLRTCP